MICRFFPTEWFYGLWEAQALLAVGKGQKVCQLLAPRNAVVIDGSVLITEATHLPNECLDLSHLAIYGQIHLVFSSFYV